LREAPITELASVVRSKNAGPFEVTFDLIFRDEATYRRVKEGGYLTRELVASLYRVPVDRILVFEFFDAARALKITMARPWPQGSVGERDMHAAQQHAPLLSIRIPWD